MASKSGALDDSLSRAGASTLAGSVFQGIAFKGPFNGPFKGSEFLNESVDEFLEQVELAVRGLCPLQRGLCPFSTDPLKRVPPTRTVVS